MQTFKGLIGFWSPLVSAGYSFCVWLGRSRLDCTAIGLLNNIGSRAFSMQYREVYCGNMRSTTRPLLFNAFIGLEDPRQLSDNINSLVADSWSRLSEQQLNI